MRLPAIVIPMVLAAACSTDRGVAPAAKPVGETFADARTQPLMIVDGKTVRSLDSVNRDDILTIEVLKGPSAARQYGDAGRNGVILVTTKSRR